VRPPRSQFTLGELMGLVALCAVGFALLTTPIAPLGAGVLVVVPGFVLGRIKGGTGIIGGSASGCLIPMGIASLWAAAEYTSGIRSLRETLDFLPALYLLFVICLVWSSLLSTALYVADRRLQGASRTKRLAARDLGQGIRFLPDDEQGIRFLPDDDRAASIGDSRSEPATSASASSGGADS
jgi:hypothetical protein